LRKYQAPLVDQVIACSRNSGIQFNNSSWRI